jgi:hypothetical protein
VTEDTVSGPRITIEPGSKPVSVTIRNGKEPDQVLSLTKKTGTWIYDMPVTEVVCVYILTAKSKE